MTPRVLRWERRPEERPSELLEVALRMFAERGYANTRLEDVAAAAGVTKGTIYHYFANKEDLLRRSMEHYRVGRFASIERALRDRRGPVSAAVRPLLQRVFGQADAQQLSMLTLLVKGVLQEVPGLYEEWLQTGPARTWQLLAGLIEAGKTSGEFRRDADSEVLARLTISGLILQFVWRASAGGAPPMDFDPDRLIDSAADFLLHALRPLGR